MDNLLSAKKGRYFVVQGIDKSSPVKIKRRVLELGFTKGQKVRVVRKSLLGETYLVELRGYILTIRKDIAKLILI